MADIPARTELKVTTGPIRGSRKIHVGAAQRRDARDRPRAALRRTAGAGLRLPPAPIPIPTARIDISAGLPAAPPRLDLARGDVEEYAAARGQARG